MNEVYSLTVMRLKVTVAFTLVALQKHSGAYVLSSLKVLQNKFFRSEMVTQSYTHNLIPKMGIELPILL